MSVMKTSQTQPSHPAKRALAALIALAALALAIFPASAGASEVPDSLLGPSVSVAFTRQSATVVGSGAVVAVKCKGPRGSSCTGTITLHLGGSSHKASFYVEGGARQNVVVPLGQDSAKAARGRARVVADTLQPLGASHRTERVLHLR